MVAEQAETKRYFRIETAYATGDPYDTYAWFRAHDPVHLGEPREGGHPAVHLFRHADVMRLLRDPRLGKEWHKLLPPDQQPPAPEPDSFHAVAQQFMLFRDPPTHTHLRGLANLAFTAREVEKKRAAITELARDLGERFRDSARETPTDLIMDFAYPLPTLVIAQILGVPQEDFPKFRQWAGDIGAAIDFQLEGLEEQQARVDQTSHELSEYFRWIFGVRRDDPQDDLISRLIHAETDGGQLNEEEVIATCILLLVAGHETTVNLIGNGTLALMRHRDQWQRLVDDPSLARSATEELLRYDGPVQLTTRVAFADVELPDAPTIPAGSPVVYLLGSANRDDAAFPDGATLDIGRDVGRIMSFGMGIHFCLGAPLARLEGELAFHTLSTLMPDLAMADDHVTWRPGAVLHGLRELPLQTAS